MLQDIQGVYLNPRNIVSFTRDKETVAVITTQSEFDFTFLFDTEDEAKEAESLLINLILQTLI